VACRPILSEVLAKKDIPARGENSVRVRPSGDGRIQAEQRFVFRKNDAVTFLNSRQTKMRIKSVVSADLENFDDRLVGAIPEERSDRFFPDWMDGLGGDFRQGDEGKAPLGQAGMRDSEVRSLDDFVSGQEDVDVHRPRTVFWSGFSVQLAFDRFRRLQEPGRRKRRLDFDRLVVKPGLFFQSDRLGSIDRRPPDDSDAFLFQPAGRCGEILQRIAGIASEP